uniref:Protein kinase domain-containing protein n=1 Tax=Panagrolaimus davidi TaxID=227884 RepID=A0A914PEC6_9BILA
MEQRFDLNDIKYFLKECITDWFNTKSHSSITIAKTDRTNLKGLEECEKSDDCLRKVDDIEYDDAIQENWGDTKLVFTSPVFASEYFKNLSYILSPSFSHCVYNSVILLTNRIVDMRAYKVTEIIITSTTSINNISLTTHTTAAITTTTSITTATTEKNNTTAPNASTSSDRDKTIIIIICGAILFGTAVIILISLFFYRKRIQQKRMEEIRLSHQNPSNIDEWELTWDKLMIKGEELGSGAFGQVLQGKLLGLEKTKTGKLIEEKEEVAIKILQRYTNELSELTFLETAEHIKKEFLIFAWQISNGMQYLASEGIIHRDLAARNILINGFKVAKISDFGLSVQINDKHKNSPTNNILQIETGKLPVKWLAIESLKNYEFSLQSDIWAFGIVLFEMYSFGEMPFAEIENSQLLKHLEDGNQLEKPELCPNEIYEIMLKCWNSNPTFRPFFDELITFFTVFLEHSTQNYGYLDLKNSEADDGKELF